jgi:hypothetical protein
VGFLDSLANHAVGLVVFCGIDVGDAVIVRVMQKPSKTLLAQVALDLAIDRACAHAEAAEFHSGAPEE